ncbi:MAG: RNA-guided pseudouridylation complex pseudouridine synthase subunit Cbf5 [Candidatus Atabeyarchaeum deiterrae]
MLSNATKLVQAILPAGKEYICIMRLHSDVSDQELKEVCEEFEGPIHQRPPLRSSVKRISRIRTIYYLQVLERDGRDILMRIGCQAGTYIRKLCHDIGEAIGGGAHMKELRRTRTGSLREDESMMILQDIVDAVHFWKNDGNEDPVRKVVRPMEEAIEHLPKIIIRDSAVDAICHGAQLAAPGILKTHTGIAKNALIGIFTLKGEIVALGRAQLDTENIISADKGIVAAIERVIMEPGVYPKHEKQNS